MLCPWTRHLICCLILVQPSEKRNSPDMTENVSTGTLRIKINNVFDAILGKKKYSKIFVSETNGPITFRLGMSHYYALHKVFKR